MDEASLQQAGWTSTTIGGFTGVAGPFWLRGEGAAREIGLLIEARHTNTFGAIHGGLVMTFADIALGVGVTTALGHGNCVTTHLQTHFVSTAQIGEFISCRPELVRKGRKLVVVRGLVKVGDKTIAAVDGIWTVIEPR